MAGAMITAVGGAVVQTVVQPSTAVADNMWSYPWSSAALVPISLLWALAHALVIVGLLGFYRSGIAGPTRSAQSGLIAAVTGTSLLLLGELASIVVRNQQVDDTGATLVGGLFALAMVLSAFGFLVAGRATLRARLWNDWRRYTPLVAGSWTVVLLGINFTKALPTGVGIYGLCLLALSYALFTRPTPAGEPFASAARVQEA
jgi:hypothetical protein